MTASKKNENDRKKLLSCTKQTKHRLRYSTQRVSSYRNRTCKEIFLLCTFFSNTNAKKKRRTKFKNITTNNNVLRLLLK